MATLEAILRVFEQPRQPRQQAARPHEVARRHDGLGRAAGAHPEGAEAARRVVHVARWHPRGRPQARATLQPVSASASHPHRSARARRSRSGATDPYKAWERRQRRARRRQGHRVGHRLRPPRRHHHRPVPGAGLDPAGARRRGPGHQPAEPRLPRARPRDSCHSSTSASSAIGMAEPGAELSPRRRRLPGCRHLQPGRHPEPGPRRRHRRGARRRGPGRGAAASARTSPAARTAAASTTSPTSGSSAPSVAPTASPRPATRCCSAATSARRQIHFGEKALRLPGQERTRGRGARRRVASPTSGRPVRRSARGSTAPAGWPGHRRRAATTSTSSPTPDRRPRVLRRLRRDRPLRGGDRRLRVRRRVSLTPPSMCDRTVHRRGAGGAQPRVRAPARRPRSSSGPWTASPPTSASAPSMTDAVLIDLATKVDPGDRGRVHRHRLPLPRDARDRRDGPPPLRPQPADDDRRRTTTRSSGRSTRRTAARPSRSASSTGPSPARRPG